MGRARIPLDAQKGNLTQSFQEQRKFEQSLIEGDKDQLLKPPAWLINAVAKNEYKRVVEELMQLDMICNLDINNIAGYCNAYAMYIKITKELKTAKPCIINASGNLVEHPLINTQKKYASEMRDFARLCGLTIDSRLKMASIKSDEVDETIENQFGGI